MENCHLFYFQDWVFIEEWKVGQEVQIHPFLNIFLASEWSKKRRITIVPFLTQKNPSIKETVTSFSYVLKMSIFNKNPSFKLFERLIQGKHHHPIRDSLATSDLYWTQPLGTEEDVISSLWVTDCVMVCAGGKLLSQEIKFHRISMFFYVWK